MLVVIGAYAQAGGMAWSTGPERGEGIPFVVGQAFADDQQVLVDLTDPNMETVLVSVRLRFDGDEDWPLTGTVAANGATYPVRCGEG